MTFQVVGRAFFGFHPTVYKTSGHSQKLGSPKLWHSRTPDNPYPCLLQGRQDLWSKPERCYQEVAISRFCSWHPHVSWWLHFPCLTEKMRVFMQVSLVGAQGCKVMRKVTHSPHECGPIAAYMGLSKYIHVYIYVCVFWWQFQVRFS